MRKVKILIATATMTSWLFIAVPLSQLKATPVPASLAYSQRLQQLPEIQRYAVLRGALNDSGFLCRRVNYASPTEGGYDNLAMWSVRCQNEKDFQDYAVFLGPDGSAQVRSCKDTASLKLPICHLPALLPKEKSSIPQPVKKTLSKSAS
ncbi:MAG: hypothetical protein ABF461_03465 [Zymomonas mobilis subsp. pomaceae]|uniref:Uncharacterized protein n=1 Tax=Zymomonas mobilis subsp. pomaceae (strain ATCC 29192 / DSM 22645 / JCM 10191 / CCUG 17912 / NBRC 13757 / NCIMB 11200 / NRRL B-4491 / Barker I) TaxID=579138 RepID=F8ETY6_ZYMMT|nr:hypothetical protein [Zymomonas mobilis]AEI38083.1 hypothetical protein Zymop_1188 [Zymomonas mobilis subsp. pomaceae ATCC 29192]MDX5949449.1 hypothetical protein [Zymomonas mobilis subsp. pomaceae]GEB89192.1 hypothetical protein ZMO02_08290 [Zymomonas mobilis subsp. pomaceae]